MKIDLLIKRLDWDKLKFFYYVAKCNSFTNAAKYLHLTQPSISRAIKSLEEQLGLELFIRTTKRLVMTEEGEILLKMIQRLIEDFETTITGIHEDQREPQGPIRIWTTEGLLNYYLLRYIPEFLEKYPGISLTFIADNNIPDFDLHEADVAIRPPIQGREDLIQHHLFTNHIRLYALPAYLEKFGTPLVPQDLDHHRLIGFGNHETADHFSNLNWHLRIGCHNGESRKPFIQANTPQGRLQLAAAGLGIAAIAAEHPDLTAYGLVEVLPNIPAPVVETYYIYARRLKGAKRVKVLADFLSTTFARDFSATSPSNNH